MMPAASGCAVRLSPERECTDCARHGDDVLHYSDRDDEQQPRERPHSSLSRTTRFHPRDRRRRRARGQSLGGRDALPARAERIPPPRPPQGDRAQLRDRPGVRRPLPLALRRHQPDRGGAGVHRLDSGRHPLARLRLGEHLYFASDYFDQLYEWAVHLIKAGKAYVDDLSAEEIREHRGTFTEPGKNSPWRERSSDENLDLFERMRAGEFADGARVLRARIDMASPNINMRDPVLYRILHATHPRTGGEWCIYPLYDFAHGQSDAIEGITHSLCTLEFEDHRPLYDWLIENLPVPSRPHQYEFARLNFTYTVLSKRSLGRLVSEGYVRGWDDPRMPTLSALRRRGFPPEGVRNFMEMAGVGGKGKSVTEIEMLEHEARDVLNRTAPRRFAVLRPLRLVIENYPEGQVEQMEAVNNPEDLSAGTREVAFAREVWIERDDFMEDPPSKFFRLAPGREVRLRYAYFVTCTDVVKDASGEIAELRCTYDPKTRGGDAPDGRRPKATLHWLSSEHAVPAEVRLYDRLFTRPDPGADGDPFADINPNSETVLKECLVEPTLVELPVGETVQFERLGYFCPDPDSTPRRLVFNRTLGLKDTWARLQA